MPRHFFLSDVQRKALQQAHFDLSTREIARYWTFSGEDLDRIHRHRRESNRFGFAVQLCLLRFPGWPPHRQDRVPLPLLQYVAKQLSMATDHIEEYFHRQPTRSDHLQEIINFYGFRYFTEPIRNQLTEWAQSQCHRWTTPKGLLLALLDEMRRQRIILPTISTLEHWAWRMHHYIEEEVMGRLTNSLSVLQRSELDQMLWPALDANDRNLTWLRRPMGIPGAKSMLDLLDRLDLIRSVELNSHIAEGINPLLLRQLASRGARHTLQHLREYPQRKRFGILVAYWLHSEQQLIDELVQLFTRLVGRWFNRADKRRWTLFQNNGRRINRILHDYIVFGRTLLQAQAERLPLGGALEKMGGREALAARIAEAEALATPLDFSNLDQLTSQYSQARQYAPRFLETLEFRSIARKQSLLRAIETLRTMNRQGKLVVPRSAPRGFVPRRWRPYVFDGECIDRAYYELCVLSELSGALRSGDIWVPGSRRYLAWEEYLIPAELWKSRSSKKPRLSCRQYLEEREPQMHRELKEVARLLQANQLPDVSLHQGVLSISPLEANVPPEAELWSDRLYDLLPRIHLADLLVEVDSWTNFSRHFQHLYTQKPAPDPSLVLAVIVSDTTNIGLTKMADAMQSRSYHRLSWVTDWYIREENYAKALAEIVNQQHQVPLAAHWGPGTTASSDGQAFPIATRKPVLAHRNAKYGRDPVVMLYSHISDRYAPFYTKAISSTVRDATYVLDGLLDHGTEIAIEEHHTDTGGVTDQIFGLCYLLGFRFAPRIRDLPDRRLFPFRAPQEYEVLAALMASRVAVDLLQRNWEALCRLADSIREGRVSASLLVSKLAAYPQQNEVGLALRELGRVERTLFTLDWLRNPALRHRAQAGLNKGELRNTLARALRFYRRGAVADRDREEQQRKASGLNLTIAAISLWNTVYLQKAIRTKAEAGEPIPEHVLAHVAPLGWEHITLTGTYHWRRYRSHFQTLRPLRTQKVPSKTSPLREKLTPKTGSHR